MLRKLARATLSPSKSPSKNAGQHLFNLSHPEVMSHFMVEGRFANSVPESLPSQFFPRCSLQFLSWKTYLH